MKALIMAGGKGSRMGYSNKPMIDIFGKPMIWYTINALKSSCKFEEILCATNSEEIIKYVNSKGIKVIRTEGKGYSIDLKHVLSILRDKLFITPADLPLLDANLVNHIIDKSRSFNAECISVMVSKRFINEFNIDNRFCKEYNGEEVCYTGISIIDASKVKDELEEDLMIIDDVRLAININSKHELMILKNIFKDYLTSSVSEHK